MTCMYHDHMTRPVHWAGVAEIIPMSSHQLDLVIAIFIRNRRPILIVRLYK
jgi:hypothetical protein